MASPKKFVTVVKHLSPKISQISEAIIRQGTPQTPTPNSRHLIQEKLSPLNIDTPNRCKIVHNGLRDKKPVIGIGAFGTVYKASYKGNEVAAKVLNGDSYRREILEAEMHAANFQHANVVRILGFDEGPAMYLIAMELCGPSLQEIIEEQPLSKKDRILIWWEIANALKYCHDAGVVHADVKPKNIFLGQDGKAKLGDFGCSILKKEIQNGTVGYEAPEVARGGVATFESDIYSLGVVAWQMLSRMKPFAGYHVHVILYLTGKGYKPEIGDLEDNFQGHYKALYREMWAEEPQKRPILNHVICKLDQLKQTLRDRK